MTSKDMTVVNTELIKQERIKAAIRNEQRRERMKAEKLERGSMKDEDYDVNDLLAGYVELTHSELQDSMNFDNDSYFEIKDKV